MDEITVSRDIAAPADKVWAMVSDITRMGEWSPEAVGGSWVKGATGPAVGARFRGKNANGKRSWSTDCIVTHCEPGARFAFDVTSFGIAIATWSYTLTSTPTGCRVEETWRNNEGKLMIRLGALVSGVSDRESHTRDGMTATLEALAASAE